MKRALQVLLLGIFIFCWSGTCAAAESGAKENGMALIRLFESKKKTTTLARIKELLQKPTDFNCRGYYGYPALACAIVYTHNPEIIDVLIKAGADVNGRIFPDRNSDTILHIATLHDAKPAIIDMLIKAGADANARNDSDCTPLFYSLDSPENMRILINAGADVNARESASRTPLLQGGLSSKEPAFIEVLVKAGADVNARDSTGDITAFLIAAGCNENPEILNELARLGVDIHARDSSGRNALMNAARFGNVPKILRQLVKMGIDVNATTETGKTALMHAVCHPVALNTLIELGADVHARDADGKNALLHAAIKAYIATWSAETINTLLKAGLDINSTDNSGRSALYYVAESEETNAMEVLIKRGADVGIRLENGKTVLIQSVSTSWKFSKECFECILTAGASVNARDDDGKTALIHAVYACGNDLEDESRVKTFIYMVGQLLKAGADKSIKDNAGKTAFDYASEQKDLANTEAYRQLNPDS